MGLINVPADRLGEPRSSSASVLVASPFAVAGVPVADTSADTRSIVLADAATPNACPRSASQQLAWQRLWSLLLAPNDSADAHADSERVVRQPFTADAADCGCPDCVERGTDAPELDLMTVDEAANYVGIGLTEMNELLTEHEGEIPVVTIGTNIWIRVADLNAWMDRYEVDCDAD